MKIEDNLLSIFNAMIKNKKDWIYVSDEMKIKWFFIFNRYMSKKYPIQAQLLNRKSIDKVSSINLWYYFMLDKPYPKWFWSKSEKIKTDEFISEKDFNLLLDKLKIQKFDLTELIKKHPDLIEEELKYYKSKIK